MKLNKIWGYGQLFGYSAFDGPNRYYEDNILMTMKEKLTFRFEFRPHYIRMSFDGFKNIEFNSLMSDFVIANTDGHVFKLTFIDNDTLIAQSNVLPSFVGEKEIRQYKHRNVDIVELNNHFLGIRYKKVGNQYLIVVHHSFTLTEARSGANYYIDNSDIDLLIKNRIAYYEKMPECKDSRYESLYYKALSVNKVNTHSAEGKIDDFWTTPDRVPHRHMWMWDSAFHSMAIVNYNQEAAKKSLLSMLKQTRENGFMPHMANPTDCSDVTQPCVMSWAVWNLYQKTNDVEFLKQCVGYLEKYLTYDIENRDVNHNGLLEWLTEPEYKECKCGESGLDNSPRFDFDEEMDCIDFSTYLAFDAEYLSKIFAVLGDNAKSAKWMKVHDDTAKKINELMWDEETGAYYDRLFSGKLTKVLTPSSFLPMFANISSKEQTEKMVKTLTDKKLLWSVCPICTISQQDPRFSNDMWRGGVWVNLNYFAIVGLKNYGYNKLADELRNITLDFVNKWYQESGCIYEFFDPLGKTHPTMCQRKGDPLPEPDYRKHVHSITDYNWSACFTLLLIQGEY